VGSQDFDPWGSVRSSSAITQTSISYTGQETSTGGTGLLYYGSRFYDPVWGRFTSADTIVPGMAIAAGGALGTLGMDKNTSMKGLTVDYHEPGMALAVNGENQFTFEKGFWFQLSNRDRQQSKTPFGPLNPQALNRYSYVVNNPLRYTDPTGHDIGLYLIPLGALDTPVGQAAVWAAEGAANVQNVQDAGGPTIAGAVAGAIGGFIAGLIIGSLIAPGPGSAAGAAEGAIRG